MQKVLIGGAVAFLLLCVGGGLYGYNTLWPRIKEGSTKAVEREVAFRVRQSMSGALVTHDPDPCQIELDPHDLSFSTLTTSSDEQQVVIENGDAIITNGIVLVGPDGVDLVMADMHLHGVPAIENGAFTFTEVDTSGILAAFMIDESALEDGFIRGVNEGLQSAKLEPTSVQTTDGVMTISCQPITTIIS